MEVESSSGPSKTGDVNVLDLENVAKENETNDSAKGASEDTAEDGKGKVGDAPLLDEGLSKIMSFLKDRMPDVKLKVFKVTGILHTNFEMGIIFKNMACSFLECKSRMIGSSDRCRLASIMGHSPVALTCRGPLRVLNLGLPDDKPQHRPDNKPWHKPTSLLSLEVPQLHPQNPLTPTHIPPCSIHLPG